MPNWDRLKNHIDEYVNVVAFCIKNDAGFHYGDNQYAVEKEKINELLERYKYATPLDKLKLWKALHWISADAEHFTKSIYIKDKAAQKRMIVISLDVHKQLAAFSK